MTDLLDADSLREFSEEAREYIVVLNRDLLELEEQGAAAPAELINNAFRAIHTIKGLSGMLGLSGINRLSHSMEDALASVRQGDLLVAGDLAGALFESLDLLSEMVESAARGDTEIREPKRAIHRLASAVRETKVSGSPGPAEPAGPAGRAEDPDPLLSFTARGLFVYRLALSLERDFGSDRPKMLGAIDALERIAEIASALPEGIDRRLRSGKRGGGLEATLIVATALPEDRLRVELGIETLDLEVLALPVGSESGRGGLRTTEPSMASSASTAGQGAHASQAIRVDVEKLDRILALVGELVISRSRYNHVAGQAIADLGRADRVSRKVVGLQTELNEVESTMTRTLTELQDAVMKARLVPLGSVFGRFRRAVRDLASRAGQRVRFESRGGETELDKKVIDQIGDPLMHLIRNAIHHGIEPPAERRARGKDEEGRILLSADHEGDRVVIEVNDDGRGIDRERIVRKAIERGLIPSERGAEVSDQEIQEIITTPGFSTAPEVTELSGRGVGMDVVRDTLANLKGTLEVRSAAGEGTVFRIKLPLTMAIVDSLLVSVARETYAIAVSSVKEILEVHEDCLHVVGDSECFRANGRVVPLVRLVCALGTEGSDIGAPAGGKETAVVVDSDDGDVGLMVDRVIGQEEIVIKALSRRFENVHEISGGSVLGDGSVCLILDVPALVAKARGERVEAAGVSA